MGRPDHAPGALPRDRVVRTPETAGAVVVRDVEQAAPYSTRKSLTLEAWVAGYTGPSRFVLGVQSQLKERGFISAKQAKVLREIKNRP